MPRPVVGFNNQGSCDKVTVTNFKVWVVLAVPIREAISGQYLRTRSRSRPE